MRKDLEENIVVAHPLQQHSYMTAIGLKRNKKLNAYLTTLYNDKSLFVYVLKYILPSKFIRILENKSNWEIDKKEKSFNRILGFLYFGFARIGKNNKLISELYFYLCRKFGINVSKYCNDNNIKMLVMYDTTAYDTFKRIKDYGTVKILDMSSAAAPYINLIINKELNKKEDNFKQSLLDKKDYYSEKMCSIAKKEIQKADYFIVPSTFVKKSIIYCGVPEENIYYLPYGVSVEKFYPEKKKEKSGRLKVLYTGRLEAAKGSYYLLEAFNKLVDYDIELIVVGSVKVNKDQLNKYAKNVKFLGQVPRADIPKLYRSADIYVMPSLWEGLSLTIFEAMASGLPVIASENSGAQGIIENYKTGFIIKPACIEDIIEKILWFYYNREQINEMSQAARNLVQLYTWDNYYKNLNYIVEAIYYRSEGNKYDS